jgi:hypothetical protein
MGKWLPILEIQTENEFHAKSPVISPDSGTANEWKVQAIL